MKHIAQLTTLVLLLTASPSSASFGTRAADQKPKFTITQTLVKVKQHPGAPNPWGLKLVLNSTGVVRFRWASGDAGVVKGLWQVGETNLGLGYNNPASAILAEGPAGADPPAGQYTEFDINFAAFTAAAPPQSPKTYFVRLVPLDAADKPSGVASISAQVVYVAAPTVKVKEADVYGTFADIYITATAAVVPTAEAGTKSPGPDDLFEKADVVSTGGEPLLQGFLKNNRMRLLNLKPDTLHFYTVKATDKNGSVVRLQGTFKTRKQRVAVTFQKIVVDDDSDDLGSGELGVGMFVGPGSEPDFDYVGDLATGDTKNLSGPKYTGTFMNPSDPLALTVRAVDNDESSFSLNTCGTLAFFEECGHLAAKTESFKLYVTGPDEEFSKSFVIKAHGEDLKLRVYGTMSVSYVP
jgi:hypothetical protein